MLNTLTNVLKLVLGTGIADLNGFRIFMNESFLLILDCCFSQDRTIAVWDMASPVDIHLRRVLVGHRAAVNVVDFDERYIVSASGDRTIKVRIFVFLICKMYCLLILFC